jgi:hypothetical protein
MDIIKHKSYEDSHHDCDDSSGDIGLIKKEYHSQDKEDECHKSSREAIESISDIDSIDDRDSTKEGEYRIEQSERYFACDRPQIDIIDTESAIKPSTDKCRKDDHTYHLCLGTQSFNRSMTFDIEKIIYESDQSHTKESKEEDVGFLSIEQGIIDPSIVFQDI